MPRNSESGSIGDMSGQHGTGTSFGGSESAPALPANVVSPDRVAGQAPTPILRHIRSLPPAAHPTLPETGMNSARSSAEVPVHEPTETPPVNPSAESPVPSPTVRDRKKVAAAGKSRDDEGKEVRARVPEPTTPKDRWDALPPEERPAVAFPSDEPRREREGDVQPRLLTHGTAPDEYIIRGGGRVTIPGRFQQVLEHIKEGYSSDAKSPRQIAKDLGVPYDTVTSVVSQMRPILRRHGIALEYDVVAGGYSYDHPTTQYLAPPVVSDLLQEERPVPRFVEREKVRQLDALIPRVGDDDRVTELADRNQLRQQLAVPSEDLKHYLGVYERDVLAPQGLRLGQVGRKIEGKSDPHYWVEQVPSPDAPDVTVMGEYARSGDKEMEIDPADQYVLSRLSRPRDKETFDQQVSDLTDSQGVSGPDRIASLNRKLRALAEVEEDPIVVDGNAEVGYFYRRHGPNFVDKPTFNGVEPGHVQGLDRFLSGASDDEVKAAVTSGITGGVSRHEFSNQNLFYNLRSDMIKLVNRGRAGMLRTESPQPDVPTEAELHARVTREFEEQGIDVYTFLSRMAAVLQVPQDQVRADDVRQQIEQPVPRRALRTIPTPS